MEGDLLQNLTKEGETAKRTIRIKGDETFRLDSLPNSDYNAYRKLREKSLQRIANASGRAVEAFEWACEIYTVDDVAITVNGTTFALDACVANANCQDE